MHDLPKVLVVEDDRDTSDLYQDCMAGKAIVLVADNTDDAVRLYQENPDIAGIMMDGELPGELASVDFVKKIKPSFHGPIAAASGGRMQEPLLKAGCNINMRKPVYFAQLMTFLNAATAYKQQR